MSAQKKGPAEAATSPSRGSNNPVKENAVNANSNTTTRADGATIPAGLYGGCMVAALADRLVIERRNADAKHESGNRILPLSSVERSLAFDRATHAEDCFDATRAMIAANRATSLEGAAIQIVEALSRIDALYESLGSKAGNADREDHRATLRLLYSALGAIESRCSFKLDDLLAGDLSWRRFDPWAVEHASGSDRDPLLDLVRKYEAGMTAYNGRSDEDEEAIQATYGPPFEALLDPAVPAPTTMEGALAALRLLVEEGKAHLDGQMAATVLPVVLSFLEREAA